MLLRRLFLSAVFVATHAYAGVTFDVTATKGNLDASHDGRIVVYVVGPDRPLRDGERPAEWDYCHEPMPVYAIDVAALKDGQHVTLDATADHFKTALDALPPGSYSAQAVFDWQHVASGWQMEPGNLFSPIVHFDVKAAESTHVSIPLSSVVHAADFGHGGAEKIEVRSKLLSDFAHREVILRAGIALPLEYDATHKYAAIYEIPGFGGTHADAIDAVADRAKLAREPASDARMLAARTFHIFLDPESPNGHTLFADSDVNGPYGRALVEELIPAIEQKYPALIAEPQARLLTGHSSGGWSACYLQLHYDATFGGAWPSSPDPIDFRHFERIDLYADESIYVRAGEELPSVRDADGNVTLHVREENAYETCVAPNNRGGQQWQSWQAVFGLPRGDGYPQSLYDITTGTIDKAQLAHYRKYDLCNELKSDPAKYAPIWREKIRLIVGGADDYFLDEAVGHFADELAKLPATGTPASNNGYIAIVPGKTHDTVYDTPEMAQFDREMLEQIDSHAK